MNRKIVFAGGAIVVVSIFAIFILSKLRQVDAGICAWNGTTLSNEKLRKKVLSNLARNMHEIVRHQDMEYLPGTIRFKVADKISDEEIAKAVYVLKDELDPFNENFGFRTAGGNEDFMKEPFVLLTYESGGNLSNVASRTASQDIQRIDATEAALGDFRPNFSQKLHGFGNHYFQIISRHFIYDCCAPSDSENSPARKLVPIVYREEGKKGEVISGGDKARIAIVSNCGEILTKNDESGFNRIKWTKGE